MRGKWIVAGAAALVLALVSVVSVVILRYDYSRFKPGVEAVFLKATGRRLTLKGDVALKFGLTPVLAVADVALQNEPWGSRREMAVIGRLEVRIALIPLIFHRRIDVKRIALIRPDILFETSAKGESNIDSIAKIAAWGVEEEKVAEGKGITFEVRTVAIRDGRIAYRDGKTGNTHVVTVDRFDASARGANKPLEVMLDGSVNGKPFQVVGNFVPFAALTDGGRPWPFDLTVNLADGTVALEGTVKDAAHLRGYDAKVTAKSRDAARFGEYLGKPLPFRGPLEVSGRLADTGPGQYRVSDMKLSVSGTDLAGSLGIDLSGPRPALTGDLRSKRLDLRPFHEKKKAAPGAGHRPGRVFPSSPLPVRPLPPVDLALSLKAGEVLTHSLTLRSLDVAITLKDGRLSAGPLSVVVAGGNVAGRINLAYQDKAVAMDTALSITRLDTGAFLKELGQTEAIQGLMDGRVDVRGRGGSVADIFSGLTGMVYGIMGKGRINNSSVALLGSDMSGNIFRMINPFRRETPSTAVSCMVLGFKVREEIAETTAFLVNTEYMAVAGNGTVNLRTEGLNFNFNPVPKQGISTGIAGRVSISVGELTRPFKLTGTLAQPSLGLDVEQAAIMAGKTLGAFMLLGPAGLGSALLSETGDTGRLCPLAAEAARRGVKLNLVEEKQGIIGKATEVVGKGLKGIGKGLKGLFRR